MLGQANATLTIFDDDFAPGLLSFASSPVVNESGASATVTVIRASGKTGTVSVDYATSDGTARQDEDYVRASGTLTFVEGEISKSFIIPLKDDSAIEGNETVTVRLSNATGGAVLGSPNSVVLTIVDDDFGPGGLDQDFNPSGGANGVVRSVVLQPDGKILVAGEFDVLGGFSLSRIGRLNPNGTVDSNFSPGAGPDDVVSAISLQSNGKIAIGGAFRQIDLSSQSWVGRLLTNGFADAILVSLANAEVPVASSRMASGWFLFTGARMAFEWNGSLDVSFDPSFGADGPIYAVALQPTARCYRRKITKWRSEPRYLSVLGASRRQGANGYLMPLMGGYDMRFFAVCEIVRLNPDGSIDPTFVPAAVTGPSGVTEGIVRALAVQADGKVYIAGSFTNVAGVSRTRIARLNLDGSLDTGFDSGRGPNDTVFSMVVQPNGKVVIGGAFNTVNGFSRNGIARLNGDPSVTLAEMKLNPVQRVADGQVQVSFNSQPGASYLVEVSTDLRAWVSLGAPAALGPNIGVLTDPAAGSGQRFYRVRRLSP